MARPTRRSERDQAKWRRMTAAVHIAFDRLRICRICRRIDFAAAKNIDLLCPDHPEIMDRLSRFEYRRYLKDWTGKTSCAEMTIGQLGDVLDRLRDLGFEPERRRSFEEARREDEAAMREKIIYEARAILGPGWQNRLERFCLGKLGTTFNLCELGELRRVWGFLRGVEKGARKNG